MGRGQVSVEYLMIIAIALGVLVPSIFLFYTYSKSATNEVTGSQLNDIGLQMVAAGKSTYALGVNARRTLEFTMPAGITRIAATGDELVIVYETQYGQSEAVFFSSIPLRGLDSSGALTPDGNISVAHPGLTRYRFISVGSEVHIEEVE
jgi:uncharacterized protein (UPF0333 family)